jgi:tetratricopeptide (TPR) repeat protein
VLIVLLLIYGGATYQRNFIWKDDISLWSDCVKKSPQKARPYIWVGLEYQKKGLLDKAIFQYRRALSLKPNRSDEADAHNNLGLCYIDKGWIEMAILEFSRALYLSPNYVPAHYNLGFIYVQMKSYEKAMDHFKAILKVDPHNEMAMNLIDFCQRNLN